jgi:hypothetical protein
MNAQDIVRYIDSTTRFPGRTDDQEIPYVLAECIIALEARVKLLEEKLDEKQL